MVNYVNLYYLTSGLIFRASQDGARDAAVSEAEQSACRAVVLLVQSGAGG